MSEQYELTIESGGRKITCKASTIDGVVRLARAIREDEMGMRQSYGTLPPADLGRIVAGFVEMPKTDGASAS